MGFTLNLGAIVEAKLNMVCTVKQLVVGWCDELAVGQNGQEIPIITVGDSQGLGRV